MTRWSSHFHLIFYYFVIEVKTEDTFIDEDFIECFAYIDTITISPIHLYAINSIKNSECKRKNLSKVLFEEKTP